MLSDATRMGRARLEESGIDVLVAG